MDTTSIEIAFTSRNIKVILRLGYNPWYSFRATQTVCPYLFSQFKKSCFYGELFLHMVSRAEKEITFAAKEAHT